MCGAGRLLVRCPPCDSLPRAAPDSDVHASFRAAGCCAGVRRDCRDADGSNHRRSRRCARRACRSAASASRRTTSWPSAMQRRATLPAANLVCYPVHVALPARGARPGASGVHPLQPNGVSPVRCRIGSREQPPACGRALLRYRPEEGWLGKAFGGPLARGPSDHQGHGDQAAPAGRRRHASVLESYLPCRQSGWHLTCLARLAGDP